MSDIAAQHCARDDLGEYEEAELTAARLAALKHSVERRDLAGALGRILATVNGAYTYRHEPGLRDDWQTPDEMHATGCGDCEDFAIAYWCVARYARLPGEPRLARLDTLPPHMVCLHYEPDNADPWVLDVRAGAVYRLSDTSSSVVYELGVTARGEPACWLGSDRVTVPSAWAGVLARLGGAPDSRGAR